MIGLFARTLFEADFLQQIDRQLHRCFSSREHQVIVAVGHLWLIGDVELQHGAALLQSHHPQVGGKDHLDDRYEVSGINFLVAVGIGINLYVLVRRVAHQGI